MLLALKGQSAVLAVQHAQTFIHIVNADAALRHLFMTLKAL